MKNIKELWRELLALVVAAILGVIILVAAMTHLPSKCIECSLGVLVVFGALGGIGFVFLLILAKSIFYSK